MIPYILFAIIIIILYYKQAPTAMVFVLVLFAVLRYDTGWDYMSYYSMGETKSRFDVFVDRYSFLWRWLISFAYKIDAPHLILAVPAIISYPVLYKGIKMLTPNVRWQSDALLVYSFWPFFYLASFSEIRQSLALSVSVLVVANFMKKKPVRSIALACINYFVHPSSLVTIPLLYLFSLKRRDSIFKTLLLTSLIAVGLVSVEFLLTIPPFNLYSVYAYSEDSFGSKISVLLIAIATYLMFGFVKIPSQSSLYDKFFCVSIIGICSSAMVYLSSFTSVATRLFLYLTFYMSFVFFVPIYYAKHSKELRHILVVLFFLLMIGWLILTRGSDNASSQYVPYKLIIGY